MAAKCFLSWRWYVSISRKNQVNNFNSFLQMREHEKALRILLHQLNDFSSAEDYCNQMSSNLSVPSKKEKEKLLLILLTVLLDQDSYRWVTWFLTAQSFTYLMADLNQNINIVYSYNSMCFLMEHFLEEKTLVLL